jgi:hypothetical protein
MKCLEIGARAVLVLVLLLAVAASTRAGVENSGASQSNDLWATPPRLPSLPNDAAASPRYPRPPAPASAPDTASNVSPYDTWPPESVEWGPLLKDSLRFLTFEHAYRMTQPNTRQGFSGPFFEDYFQSVANIHGWHDGDPFATNSIGHPIQGAISGDIWIAHDPRYRRAVFSWSSSHYWKSRLRATAFAAAYSLQFEIGPLSEASMGNVQQAPRATGVVDWVITPTVGLGWMVAEDAVDAKLIARWESRTTNRAARIMLRGLLNPSRSMSNLMQIRPPWHRDTRPGIGQF